MSDKVAQFYVTAHFIRCYRCSVAQFFRFEGSVRKTTEQRWRGREIGQPRGKNITLSVSLLRS